MLKKLKIYSMIIFISFLILVSQNVMLSAATLRLMPLGDSITAVGNWRSLLLSNLTSSGYDIEFVGTLYDGGTAHEGHSGLGAIYIADSGELANWLSSTNPDIVIMHLGTNDCWGTNRLTTEIIASFTILVEQMRANNPNMIIFVAKIIPMYPTAGDETSNNHVLDLNANIDGWASGLNTSQSPIIVVDQYTGFDTSVDTYDGVHPSDAGCIKIANKWFEALDNFLSGTTTTTTGNTTTTTAFTTTTTTTAATGSCTCDAGCDSRTTISSPFSQDGVGEYCWETTSLGSYINSWNMDKLEINDVDYTNAWSSSFPEKINGVYYVYYKGSYDWSHFEVGGVGKVNALSQEISTAPKEFQLAQNYPNPFNSETNISYQLSEAGNVLVEIYDLQGHKVKTLVHDRQNAGYYSINWNSLDESGKRITSGVYMYRIRITTANTVFDKSMKMLLLK